MLNKKKGDAVWDKGWWKWLKREDKRPLRFFIITSSSTVACHTHTMMQAEVRLLMKSFSFFSPISLVRRWISKNAYKKKIWGQQRDRRFGRQADKSHEFWTSNKTSGIIWYTRLLCEWNMKHHWETSGVLQCQNDAQVMNNSSLFTKYITSSMALNLVHQKPADFLL